MESPNGKQVFGSDWTDSTFFVQVKGGAYCLLCPDSQKILKSTKKFALGRHFIKKHSEIYEKSVESRTEIMKIQNSEELKQNYETMSHVEFFNSLENFEFRHVKFFSSLCCESLFSTMKLNKSSIRSNLTDASLDAIMRICSSNASIDFEQMVNENA